MEPRVLVGAPVCDLYEYCFDEFLNTIKNLTYKNYDILLVDNSKDDKYFNKIKDKVNAVRIEYIEKMRERVVKSHNILRKEVLDKKYDYLLVLDQDVIPPPNVIEQLIRHKKDAVSALFFGHHNIGVGKIVMPFAWVFIEKKDFWGEVGYLTEEEIWSNELIEIAYAGMGCILIARNILEKVEFRYDKSIDAWDDRWLGYDIHKNGFGYYLDTSVKCRHLYLNRPFDYHELKGKGLV